MKYFILLMTCLLICSTGHSLQQPPQPPSPPPPGGVGQQHHGPWNNDIHVSRVSGNDTREELAVFSRAGVASNIKLSDGRLLAAHQHFPDNDEKNFDRVAVHFSSDDGVNWTEAAVITVEGLPMGYRFPFDPTLVETEDGRIRMYFTSMKGRRFSEATPSIFSAISEDGINYTFEPGSRFAIEGEIVIDCSAVFDGTLWHLYSPVQEHNTKAYHAISEDGLEFTRVNDVSIPVQHPTDQRRWLGCAIQVEEGLRFYGTASAPGPSIWTATSPDGVTWTFDRLLSLGGADPGVVHLDDGALISVVTGPRVQGRERKAPRPRDRRGEPPRKKPSQGQPRSP